MVSHVRRHFRHPELVSGSILQPARLRLTAEWMLKQVQHDRRRVSLRHFRQRLDQLALEIIEIAFDAASPSDQDMIRAGDALKRQKFARKRTKTALHPIPDDSAANLLGHGDADSHPIRSILTVMNQKDESGHGRTLSTIGRKEILTAANRAQAERDLRPRARRARMMLRPPGVDIRSRKP
ncbi:hypothetical protein FHS49_001170 [Sphingobium boeckii]|uniref:Uncharacterized protein n=1 Tax=Sphingobium boeckii TaxID=1082345 RepID=A0A7W9AGC7_9SPHN|nr:hypothetical protein [Sphingobium boeckii]